TSPVMSLLRYLRRNNADPAAPSRIFTRGHQKSQSRFRMCKSWGSEQELPLTRAPPLVRALNFHPVSSLRSMIAFWYGRRRAAAHLGPFPVPASNEPLLRLLTYRKTLHLTICNHFSTMLRQIRRSQPISDAGFRILPDWRIASLCELGW